MVRNFQKPSPFHRWENMTITIPSPQKIDHRSSLLTIADQWEGGGCQVFADEGRRGSKNQKLCASLSCALTNACSNKSINHTGYNFGQSHIKNFVLASHVLLAKKSAKVFTTQATILNTSKSFAFLSCALTIPFFPTKVFITSEIFT